MSERDYAAAGLAVGVGPNFGMGESDKRFGTVAKRTHLREVRRGRTGSRRRRSSVTSRRLKGVRGEDRVNGVLQQVLNRLSL